MNPCNPFAVLSACAIVFGVAGLIVCLWLLAQPWKAVMRLWESSTFDRISETG